MKSGMGTRARGRVGVSRNTWIAVGFFVACLLPAWAVKSASQQSRIWWVVCVLLLAFAGLMSALIERASNRPVDYPMPHVIRRRPLVGMTIGLSFLAAELIAIAVTHEGFGWGIASLAALLTKVGSILFPVVARYSSEIEPALSPFALIKTQTIMSAFLLAGTVSSVTMAAAFFSIPDAERRLVYEQLPRRVPSSGAVFACASFAILVALNAYLGWSEFGAPTAKYCLLEANCFAHKGDLAILAASILKTFAILAFPLGALFMLDMARLRSDRR